MYASAAVGPARCGRLGEVFIRTSDLLHPSCSDVVSGRVTNGRRQSRFLFLFSCKYMYIVFLVVILKYF